VRRPSGVQSTRSSTSTTRRAVDDVVQVTRALVPEALLEGRARLLGERREALLAPPPEEERMDPERLHLDRLAGARSHHLVAHLGVHVPAE
jgi:hypothetical protein